jgi:hypothetical protein
MISQTWNEFSHLATAELESMLSECLEEAEAWEDECRERNEVVHLDW